jgi:heat shock protein HtpX
MKEVTAPAVVVARADIRREIRQNQSLAALLLAPVVVTVLVVGTVVGVLVGLGVLGVVVGLVLAAVVATLAYRLADRVALGAAKARPAGEDEHPRLHNLVDGLCIAAGLPKPALAIVDDPAPNALTTGQSPKRATLVVTTGMLAELNYVELEGVLAHELSHVKRYDPLVATVAVVAVPPVALVAPPLAARLTAATLGHDREVVADSAGVQLTRYPPGLASALRKLQARSSRPRHVSRATAPLWIDSPLGRAGVTSSRDRVFETHPPLEERIELLDAM